jgi:hypothetical protein
MKKELLLYLANRHWLCSKLPNSLRLSFFRVQSLFLLYSITYVL